LDAGESSTVVPAVVDSGAERSMFPLQIAKRLGIADALVRDEIGARGVEGAGFPTWSYPVGLRAWVMRITENPSEVVVWGESFVLNPAFCEKDPFLLGRHDFFATFHVSFDPGNPYPTFSIADARG
jgi:hypothetical protein